MKKLLKLFLLLVVLIYAESGIYAQGNTTSSISGNVYDKDSQTLPGASILAIHTPSGTRYTASTDYTGNFRISNMRVGGPYKIVFTFVGFKTFEEHDVYLQLGDSKNIKVVLVDEASQLSEVVVKGSKNNTFNSNRTGAQTVINSDQIKALPSLSRNIADFARLTPQAQLRGDDVLSIGGQNNRFNAIYIDGAVSNDVFGLAANGTNGGQTGVSPISVDAIEQFQVSVAPYDVKLSGFAGGAISAITKSGTNKFEGSAYFFNRDQNFAGKTPPSLAGTTGRQKLADFSAQTYGVRAGGAIKEDKLFYFINYERQDNETPQPFDFANYKGSAKVADIEALKTRLIDVYKYNPGSYSGNVRTLKSDKLIGKIDWNINDNHKLSLKHSFVKAENFSPNRSSATAISFVNGSQLFSSKTNSTALELNSRFGNKFSNNLVVAYTSVIDDRDALGDPFPSVQIIDGTGNIYFGAEGFSTANFLSQKTLTISDNFEINSGMSKITIGTHNEFSSSRNVFLGNNFGSYRFSTLNDFMVNNKPNRFQMNYSLIGGEGDDSQGAAEFGTKQFGFYVQNEMKVSDNFKLSYGVRVDIPVWEDGLVNDDFNTRTVGLLETAGKNLKGARVGQGINSSAHLAPRLGFNYDLNGNKSTQFRGGLGVFTSRLPLVWPGGTYNNNGISQGSIPNLSAADMPFFNPNPSVGSQIMNGSVALGPLPGSGKKSGNIDLFAKDFKLPQVFKASFAVDQKLPFGFVFTSEITYNDNMSAVMYENLNIKAASSNLTGADKRPRYNGNTRVDAVYNGIYLASNTSEGKAHNIAFTLTKNFRSDFIDANVSGTYTYGKSTVLVDATSSQNASQWQYMESVNGANALTVSRSDFDPGRRIISNGNATFKWSKFTKSRIGLFYEGAQGTPISYVYNDRGALLQDTFQPSALIYVPANKNEINLVTANGLTPDQQWDALSAFIEGNDYLRTRKGNYAERNGDRLKTSHIVDLKFAQEFTINSGKKKHTLEFTADVFNFTNLLNKNWGKRYFVSNDQVLLLQHVGFLTGTNTPTFSYNPTVGDNINQVDDVGLNSSRWQMQVGVRYTFN
jgi:hypothetical protein